MKKKKKKRSNDEWRKKIGLENKREVNINAEQGKKRREEHEGVIGKYRNNRERKAWSRKGIEIGSGNDLPYLYVISLLRSPYPVYFYIKNHFVSFSILPLIPFPFLSFLLLFSPTYFSVLSFPHFIFFQPRSPFLRILHPVHLPQSSQCFDLLITKSYSNSFCFLHSYHLHCFLSFVNSHCTLLFYHFVYVCSQSSSSTWTPSLFIFTVKEVT